MWLLAIALQLQGLSAATMAACAAGHHEHAAADAAAQAHHEQGMAIHTHERISESGPHSHGGTDVSEADKSGFGKDVSQKCSACAACCTSAAVPAETTSFDTVELTDLFAPVIPRTVAAYVTEGLERPPRLFLA